MTMPPDPIWAVTAQHPDQVYAELGANRALSWSEHHRMWVAAHPSTVREVLEDPNCLVRPHDARVPVPLNGTRAGDIFGKLVRMTDGDEQVRMKRAIVFAIDSLEPDPVRASARRAATLALAEQCGPRFPYNVSAYALGQLFGVPGDALPELARWAGDFARCLAPTASDQDVAAGVYAAEQLWWVMSGLATGTESGPLTMALRQEFERERIEGDALIANMIGFLFQAHDAVAGLIGNTVVHLSRTAGALQGVLYKTVAEVAQSDPAIQNTRRFAGQDIEITGQSVRAGDAILVVLGAGAGEPACACPFGHGRHACPGAEIAVTIGTEAVDELVRHGAIPTSLKKVAYRPLANARIPELDYVPTREPGER